VARWPGFKAHIWFEKIACLVLQKRRIIYKKRLQGELRSSIRTLERELKNCFDFIVPGLDTFCHNQLLEPEG